MFTTPRLILIALGAALNFSIGTIVYLIKLPIYLDSIGTILTVLLLAPDRLAAFFCAWAAGWASLAVSGLVNPFLPCGVLPVDSYGWLRPCPPGRDQAAAALAREADAGWRA